MPRRTMPHYSKTQVEMGARIAKLRSAAQLTQQQLADRAGMSRGMLSYIETGRNGSSFDLLERIAAALDVPIAAFFDDQVYTTCDTEKQRAASHDN